MANIQQKLCGYFSLLIAISLVTSLNGQEADDKASAGDQPGKAVTQFVQRALAVNDGNGDGKITKEEAKQLLRRNFGNVDANKDGVVTAEELRAVARRINARNANASGNGPAVPDNVIFETDIAYREGNEKWKLDLARPKTPSAEPQAAIVFIHGGGWSSGDKSKGLFRSLTLEYASRGYVCVSVNYRLTDEAKLLDCIADCKCAVRWLRASSIAMTPRRCRGNSMATL